MKRLVALSGLAFWASLLLGRVSSCDSPPDGIVNDNPAPVIDFSHVGFDAGAGTSPFPVDPGRALSGQPLFVEDVDPILIGADIAADPAGPNGTFYTLTQSPNGPQPISALVMYWGAGSVVFDGSSGIPAINSFAVAGQSCSTINTNFASVVAVHINSHARDVIIDSSCILNDSVVAATAASHLETLVSTAVTSVSGVSGFVYVTSFLDAPSNAGGFANSVNTLLRAHTWAPAVLVDVAADPGLGLAAGSTCPYASTDVRCCLTSYLDRQCDYGVGSGDSAVLNQNGRERWSYLVMSAMVTGGW